MVELLAVENLRKSAKGNVFAKNKIVPYAKGGVLSQYANKGIVSRPTIFPMANGMGLMGEAGGRSGHAAQTYQAR